MKRGPLEKVLRHCSRAAVAGLGDGELMEAFVASRDAASFEALVRRHGAMVLGVCRRLLGNEQDAEDAFQATFLVLLRRAESVTPPGAVGNWLYGVAYRTALDARKAAARRRARERQMDELPHPAVEPAECWNELQPLLDRELTRLPDKYRTAVVLCDLEGRSRKEAARQLGLAEGTVSGRLTTARRLLAERLSRRGVALSGAALGVVLAHGTASAGVPPALVASTVQAAALPVAAPAAAGTSAVAAVGAGSQFGGKKLKVALVLLLATVAFGGGGWMAYRAASTDGAAPPRPVVVLPRPAPAEMADRERLQGTWVAVSSEMLGVKQADRRLAGLQFAFAGDRVTYHANNRAVTGTFRLDPSQTPRQMDIAFDGGEVTKAIYEVDGPRLRLCWSKLGGRPDSFDTAGEMFTVLFEYEKKP